ncbi:aromatic ring-hydroxylating dioxygenase subunit alpha [Streptomyces sp. NBC_00654]|uniref:aromatic ring-hydroxylating oxygenase subunit alpha n=1 Tax=Streptomyces sp. NBC_00654 TaxID=2975799 RepID=UPI00224FBAC7|nr:aromatic ring-hydroxylating dioxygenase subunit alpha [Streptomyces sp. NBC_00654]MCX4970452.1 aromatic ring-hydroxylating dioxygenase subunit alpha [Streptomyces sp. NBC_00654]
MTVNWPPAYYTSEEHFTLEQERIFERSWQCVARSSEIAEVGSFVRVNVGRESVLLVRKAAGEIRALINLCRHRGAQLCLEDKGNFGGSIRCPYHGWTFSLDGHLTAAPFMRDLPPETKERHLFTAGVTEWLGYVWVNLDPDAAPLTDQVGPLIRERFGDDDVPGNYGCDELRVAKEVVYEVPANWKILYENFCECYHCSTMHPEICQILPSWRTGYGTVSGPEGPRKRGSALAEGATGFSLSGKAAAARLPGVPEGDARTFHGILLWPNVHLMFIPDHVMCMRFEPVGPDRTKVVTQWLFHPEAMDDPDFSPEDAAALVDVTAREDFEACVRVQRAAGSQYFEEFHTPHESLIITFREWVLEQLDEREEKALAI